MNNPRAPPSSDTNEMPVYVRLSFSTFTSVDTKLNASTKFLNKDKKFSYHVLFIFTNFDDLLPKSSFPEPIKGL